MMRVVGGHQMSNKGRRVKQSIGAAKQGGRGRGMCARPLECQKEGRDALASDIEFVDNG